MQNQSKKSYKVLYDPQELSGGSPISFPGTSSYSPPAEPISYMHYHNCMEIGYCYKGCGIFFIDGRVQPFSAGAASIIFENQIHIAQSDSQNPSEWKFLNLDLFSLLSGIGFFDTETLMRFIKKIPNHSNIFESSHTSAIPSLIREIISELEHRKENYLEMVKSLVFQLILKLSRECPDFDEYRPKSKSFPDMVNISPSLKYISDNYPNKFGLTVLAQLCNMSMSNFRKVFKSNMNMSPGDYLHLVRIKMASILLRNTRDSVLNISLKVGYPTLSSFNRQFGKIMGMSPREWRKSEDPAQG